MEKSRATFQSCTTRFFSMKGRLVQGNRFHENYCIFGRRCSSGVPFFFNCHVIVLLDFLEYCIAAFNEIKSLSRMISISSSAFFWDKFFKNDNKLYPSFQKGLYAEDSGIEGEEHLFDGREICGGQLVLTMESSPFVVINRWW